MAKPNVRKGVGQLYINNQFNVDELELLYMEEHDVFMDEKPFNNGGMRECFFVRFGVENSPVRVAKKYIYEHETFLEDFVCAYHAQNMAVAFNKLIQNKVTPSVKVQIIVPHCILHFEGVNYFIEPYLGSTFVKHNDIFGNIYTEDVIAETYSYFTYIESRGKFVVLDIQGVGYFYTDVALCSIDRHLGGVTDVGEKAISAFLQNYRYNPLIAALGLPELREHNLDALRSLPPTSPQSHAHLLPGALSYQSIQQLPHQSTQSQLDTSVDRNNSSSRGSERNGPKSAPRSVADSSSQTHTEPIIHASALKLIRETLLSKYKLTLCENPTSTDLYALLVRILKLGTLKVKSTKSGSPSPPKHEQPEVGLASASEPVQVVQRLSTGNKQASPKAAAATLPQQQVGEAQSMYRPVTQQYQQLTSIPLVAMDERPKRGQTPPRSEADKASRYASTVRQSYTNPMSQTTPATAYDPLRPAKHTTNAGGAFAYYASTSPQVQQHPASKAYGAVPAHIKGGYSSLA